MNSRKYVGILSGGLDSTTMVYSALARDIEFTSLVSFNYGQRHKKELEFAARTAQKLGIKHHLIDLFSAGVTNAISTSQSALVNLSVDVPEGHYAEETMKATVVPNRNMMMVSIAGAIAVAEGAHGVMTGVHSGDHAVYPDCRPEFIQAASETLFLANIGLSDMSRGTCVFAPYLNVTKAQIALEALNEKVPLHETWSCYKGGEKHCGKCGTCVERLEAITEAQAIYAKRVGNPEDFPEDLTEYEDIDFWMIATEGNK